MQEKRKQQQHKALAFITPSMIWRRCPASPYVSIIFITLLECFCFDSFIMLAVNASNTATLSAGLP